MSKVLYCLLIAALVAQIYAKPADADDEKKNAESDASTDISDSLPRYRRCLMDFLTTPPTQKLPPLGPGKNLVNKGIDTGAEIAKKAFNALTGGLF